jgi:Protein of unknown function (DUF1592)/Protein of unknown function (DUF1588)/Protein of unknown function (DUF1595)/Protein of unknown function (DUF1585)/Protein of unknown function (DUF1587)
MPWPILREVSSSKLSLNGRHVTLFCMRPTMAAATLLFLCSCQGAIVGGGTGLSLPSTPVSPGAVNPTVDPGVTPPSEEPPPALNTEVHPPAELGRITSAEYQTAVQSLLPGLNVATALPNEKEDDGFFNRALLQAPSSALVGDIEANAMKMAQAAVSKNLEALVSCTHQTLAQQKSCGRSLAARFGRRAYGRPLNADETARFGVFFDSQLADLGFSQSIESVLAAILQAPPFLYRIETGRGTSPNGLDLPLKSHELARRLASFLWDDVPDEALITSAETGALDDPLEYERQTRRLVADPKARRALKQFHTEWLKLSRLAVRTSARSPSLYPAYDAATGSALLDSLERFVDWSVWQGGGLNTLLTSRQAFVDSKTALILKVPAPANGTPTLTQLDDKRMGLLTQPGLLAGLSHTASDAPVLRGVFVLERLLCASPPAPPPGVSTSTPEFDPLQPRTTRQILELTHEQGSCAGCHRSIDGIGFGLGHFGATGEWRDTENGLPVNAQGNLFGSSFEGAVGLGSLLNQSRDVKSCLTRTWFANALGRKADATDEEQLYRTLQRWNAIAPGDLRELLVQLSLSDSFRTRPVVKD